MNVNLKWQYVTIIALLGVAWWNPEINLESTPTTPEIPTPVSKLKKLVQPIVGVLKNHPEQAAELASFYATAADMIRRDGVGDKVLTGNRQLRDFLERSVTLRFQGAFEAVPGLSPAIHGSNGAIAKILGLEAGPLDPTKAAAAIEAVAWACQEAAK